MALHDGQDSEDPDTTLCLLEKGLYIKLPESKVIYIFSNEVESGNNSLGVGDWTNRIYRFMHLDSGDVSQINNALLKGSNAIFLRIGGGEEEAFQCVAAKLASERDKLIDQAKMLDRIVREMSGPEEEPSSIIVPGR